VEHPAKLLELIKTKPNNPPDRAGLFDPVPPEAGPRLATVRGGAALSIRPPSEQTFTAQDHYAAVILTPSPGMESGYASDRMHKFDAPVGMLVICPAQVESRAIWTAPRENVTVALPPDALTALAQQELDVGRVDLRPIPFGTVDPKALALARMLKAELSERATPNELYVDSLITVFGIHLLRTYAGRCRPQRSARGGLPTAKARRVREFLQANLWRKLAVAELAALCDLSSGHFIQAFTQSFGQSSHQYLLHLRLGEAERLLLQGDLSITEIAHLSGFSSQSHLTSATRRHKGTTPAQIRGSR
jgi:AraC family transcriptional regulator